MRLGGRPGLRRALSQPARPALLGFARALQRETSAVCSWRLKSRNRERKFERPHQEARRPLLRAQAPAPPPGAPRAHSDRGLKTTEEKNGPKFFPCKRYPHSRARFAVGCAATLLPTQIGNAPPAYSLVLTPGRPHAAFCLTCTFFSAISSVHGRALHESLKEKWPITHRYAERLRLATSRAPREPPRVTPRNVPGLERRSTLIAHLLGTPQPRAAVSWSDAEPGARRPTARARGGRASFWKMCEPRSPQSG